MVTCCEARISAQNTATCLEQNRTFDTLTFYWSIKSAAVLQSFKVWIELNHLAENDCQILPDQLYSLYTMNLNECFSSEKAIKKDSLAVSTDLN